ncbi:unnamed protein product, partial [Sphenostylis stenocarpa]
KIESGVNEKEKSCTLPTNMHELTNVWMTRNEHVDKQVQQNIVNGETPFRVE